MTHDDMIAYWSTYADAYEEHQLRRLAHPKEGTTWAHVWGAALPEAPATIVDMCTGTGHAALTLAQLGHRVTGIDLSEGMLAHARVKAAHMANAPTFLVDDAADPQLVGEFDAITARYAVWTLRDPVTSLRRWHDLLAPGGRLVIVDSLWFPEGLLASDLTRTPDARMQSFREAYRDLLPELPLAEASSIDAFASVIEQAGFTEVCVDELPEILELDARFGVAKHHRPQMNYRISARRADEPRTGYTAPR